MRALLMLIAIASVGCAQAEAGANAGDDPPRTASSHRTKYHMRQQLADLRAIEQRLLDGNLEDARALAHLLTRSFGSVHGSAEAREVAIAAAALMNARTIDEALRSDVRVATACASCHQRVRRRPDRRLPARAPADKMTLAAQMARHQWAVDRLREGLIGAGDMQWRAGLYVLATSSLPQTLVLPRPLAKELQTAARAALDARTTPSLDERARVYATLLGTCVACHAQSARL
jgi:cytochrome c553